MSDFIFNAITRKNEGTARMLRRQGNIPAVLYGSDRKNESIYVDEIEVLKKVKDGYLKTKVFNLAIDNAKKTYPVIVKDIQRNVVNEKIMHLDFLELKKGSTVKMFIPLKAINSTKSPGIKKGGVINVVLDKIELELSCDNIPQSIEIDLDGMMLNQSVLMKDIILPKGATVVKTKANETLLNIIPPSSLKAKMSVQSEDEDNEGDAEEEKS